MLLRELDPGRGGGPACGNRLVNGVAAHRVGMDVQAQRWSVELERGDVLHCHIESCLHAGHQSALCRAIPQAGVRAIGLAKAGLERRAVCIGNQRVPAQGLHMGGAGADGGCHVRKIVGLRPQAGSQMALQDTYRGFDTVQIGGDALGEGSVGVLQAGQGQALIGPQRPGGERQCQAGGQSDQEGDAPFARFTPAVILEPKNGHGQHNRNARPFR